MIGDFNTVGQLRAALADQPDDMLIWFRVTDTDMDDPDLTETSQEIVEVQPVINDDDHTEVLEIHTGYREHWGSRFDQKRGHH